MNTAVCAGVLATCFAAFCFYLAYIGPPAAPVSKPDSSFYALTFLRNGQTIDNIALLCPSGSKVRAEIVCHADPDGSWIKLRFPVEEKK